MTDVAIRLDGLSKRYRIGERERYLALRDLLAHALMAPFRRPISRARGRDGAIWALRDVSFEVRQGEVVGIIGRNGAGKSTLLKILSRITRPTAGRAEVFGRVGSLLEVGTGFHTELTGRENVYLSGAILGMKKAEIDRKFEEIVTFAEVEEFLDTPVKHYSSGMYVRLAFAVAAHLEPEVLLVDEVLAVGDATYQRKCVNRIATLAATGRTVIFVSHNMDLVPRLCGRAILLEHGRVQMAGAAAAVVEEYLAWQLTGEESEWLASKPRTGNGRARFTRLQVIDAMGNTRPTHASGEDLILHMQIVSEEDISDVALAVVLQTLSGARIITSWTREANFPVSLCKGIQTYECRFRGLSLRPGHVISVSLWMEAGAGVIDSIEDSRIIPIGDGQGTQYLSPDRHQGIVVCDYSWSRACQDGEVRRGK